MSKKPTKPKHGATKGNFIAEWFGRRVWNTVDPHLKVYDLKSSTECPFLSVAIGESRACIKTNRRDRPTGVCTISSDANGTRQDWLACPYRTLDKDFTLIKEAVHLLFKIPGQQSVLILSGEAIKKAVYRKAMRDALSERTQRVFIFLADKMGGEVDIPETLQTPGTKVDVSIIEISSCDEAGLPNGYGRHVHFEIQTADFHGSPLHAVDALEELAVSTSSPEEFYLALSGDIEMCGIGVEGPNKSNVFKRTFYQAVLKIRFAEADDCAGFILVIPTAVWESWKKHLGNPTIRPPINGRTALARNEAEHEHICANAKAWIFVFDIDQTSGVSPQPLRVVQKIGVTTEILTYFAFEKVGEEAINHRVIDNYRKTMAQRIRSALTD